MRAFRIVTYLAVAAGIGMYIVALATRLDRLNVEMISTVLLNSIPYGICLVLDRKMNRPVVAVCSSVLLLTVDVWLFENIIDGRSLSMSNFIYSLVISRYSPLLKLTIVLPCGWLVSLLLEKLCLGTSKGHPPGQKP